MGETIGRAAATVAKSLPSPKGVNLPSMDTIGAVDRDVRGTLIGVRPTQDLPTIPLGSRPLPVLGTYDVVVIGGGTSGAAAGIGAARRGARTLVVEYQEGLGGVGTLGFIGRYHCGLRIGFTAEVPAQNGEAKMEWWRAELRKAGADIWFGALGCGVFVDGSTIKGAVVATPERRGVVLTQVVIDLRKLQEHLVQKGNLDAEVLQYKDSLPMPPGRVATAAQWLKTGENMSMEAAIMLLHRDVALPSLRDAHASAVGAVGEERITYARFLGVCSDPAALPTLIAAIQDTEQWDPKIPLGAMAEYSQLPTRLDALILAIGFIRDSRTLPAILRKAEKLDASVCLSHHRAVALALEQIDDPAAAEPLAELLRKPRMMGHAKTSLDKPSSRIEPLREIVLARALFRCGDHQGLGKKILSEYTQDIRGRFAWHATAVLGDNDH